MKQLPYWLAALMLPDIGPCTVMQWLDHFADIKKIFSASVEEWRAAGIAEKHIDLLQKPNWTAVEKELAWINKTDRHIISMTDDAYPALLREIADPPLVLYVWGNKTILRDRQIAMVGARNATPMGLAVAEKFAFQLAEAGLAVTSGLAIGIDGASHRGALAAKGRTIGVMATGLHHIYPLRHKALARQIVENGGAIISEFPLSMAPLPHHFPRRNRIISGLSLGVLLVEGMIKSGSLITARHAMEQNREVFAIPGSINNPLSKGCHHLIRQGAKLVETVEDIIEEFSIPVPGASVIATASLRSPKQSTDPRYQLLAQIDYAITPFDVIVLRSRLTVGEVSSMLLSLVLEGCVQSMVGGYIRV